MSDMEALESVYFFKFKAQIRSMSKYQLTRLVILLNFLCFNLASQEASYNIFEDKSLISLPALDHLALNKRYNSIEDGKPFRFAEARDVNVDMHKGGSTEVLKSGKIIWRQAIQSKNAYSINLAFTLFKLNGDAELYIYNPDRSDVFGPFTEADNEDHLQLWTPMVEGDVIIVELTASIESFKRSELLLSRVNHDFKDIRKNVLSGSCNLDVACGENDGWGIVDAYRDIISSVGAYTLNGIDQCTGVLINNTAQDCRPFFLTADHCNVNAISAPSMVVFWNYENSICRQPGSLQSGRTGDGQRNQFNTGAIHRASLFESDFTLVELDDAIDPANGLFFAGWNRRFQLPDTSICIHHPNVEEKRISFDFDALDYDPNGQDTAFILVNDWDIGTTEPGSSGAPLFNTDKQIIGQLLGGLAACGNNEYDTYGWIRRSWNGGGNPGSSLRTWLDPINSGVFELDGKSCTHSLFVSKSFFEICGLQSDEISVELSVSEFFESNVNYSIQSASAELDISLDFVSGSKSQINFLRIAGLSSAAGGDYSIVIEVSDGINTAEATVQIDLDDRIPALPVVESPLDLSEDQLTTLELSLKRTSDVINEFQVAEDSLFQNIIFSTSSSQRTVIVNNLENDSRYYWRARSSNTCGASGWTPVFRFTTVPSFCTRFKSLDTPFTIDEINASQVISEISVPYPVYVQDANVLNIRGTHEYISDLKFSLSFSNRKSILMSEVCGDQKDFNLGFDDEAETLHIPCPPTDSNIYIPVQPLDKFDGLVAGGSWRMLVDDLVNFDGGSLEEWQLELCISEAFGATLIPADHYIRYCAGEDVQLGMFYELATASDEFDIRAFNRNEEALDVQVFPRLSNLNLVDLIIGTSDFEAGNNAIRFELVSKPSGTVVAFAAVNFISEGEAEAPEVSYPAEGSRIKPENFKEVIWTDVGAESYDVIIALDDAFNNVVLEASGIKASRISFNDALLQGEYYIRVTGYQDCGIVFSETRRFILDEETSTFFESLDKALLYPNPVKDRLTLVCEAAVREELQLKILDIHGKLVYDAVIYGYGKQEIDVSELSKGVYILSLSNTSERRDLKFVKL